MNTKSKQITAVFLAGTMLAGCSGQNIDAPETKSVLAPLAAPVYPEMSQYPNEQAYILDNGDWDDEGFDLEYEAWSNDRKAQLEKGYSYDYSNALSGFFKSTAPLLLGGGEDENRLYSPVNVYMALSMLTETTDGKTRAQLLSLLGSANLVEQENISNALWNANYCDDGALTSTIANSIWLRDGASYNDDTLKTLADDYYAYSFSGEMGSDIYNATLQNWINSQTGELLADSVQNMTLSTETVIALASTIYYRAKWTDEFFEDNTYSDTFHAKSGDLECDFMHKKDARNFYYTDGFNAVKLELNESGGMWFILPDEGKTTDDVINSAAFYELLDNPNDFPQKYIQVELSVPKFDVTWNSELSEQLKALGVTDAFDADKADFSPLTDENDGLFLSKVNHSVRVAVDEKGVTAAAVTLMAVCGMAMPPEETAVMNLNRPFIFAITGSDGSVLFAGTVNCP